LLRCDCCWRHLKTLFRFTCRFKNLARAAAIITSVVAHRAVTRCRLPSAPELDSPSRSPPYYSPPVFDTTAGPDGRESEPRTRYHNSHAYQVATSSVVVACGSRRRGPLRSPRKSTHTSHTSNACRLSSSMEAAVTMSEDDDSAELITAFQRNGRRKAAPPRPVQPPSSSRRASRSNRSSKTQDKPDDESLPPTRRAAFVRPKPVVNREEYTYFEPQDEVEEVLKEYDQGGNMMYEVRLCGDTVKRVSEIPASR
jgi:hypothetical protein